MRRPVYLDNHATTRADPRVVEAMLPYFTEKYGNAASSHRFGWDAEEAVERAREQVAALIGADQREIIFTSGATESNNLAIKGVARADAHRGKHLVTAATEHKAVLDAIKRLAREGFDVTFIDCDESGGVSAEAIDAALTRSDTSWSRSCRPTTRSARSTRSPRSAGCATTAASSSTPTPPRPWASADRRRGRPSTC